MFYNKLPDFSPVMVAKVEYWFEIAKIMTGGFMNNYNVEEYSSTACCMGEKINIPDYQSVMFWRDKEGQEGHRHNFRTGRLFFALDE